MVVPFDCAFEFDDGVLNSGGRDDRLRDQTAGGITTKFLDPIVIGAHAGDLELGLLGINPSPLQRSGTRPVHRFRPYPFRGVALRGQKKPDAFRDNRLRASG